MHRKRLVSILVFIAVCSMCMLYPVSVEAASSKEENVLRQVRHLAAMGQVINSSFSLNSAKQHVVRGYGNPDPFPKSTKTYIEFAKRNLAFHLNDHLRIDQITTTDPRLMNISLQQILKTLGRPDVIEHAAGHNYLSYYLGQYELVFVWNNMASPKLTQVIVQHKSINT